MVNAPLLPMSQKTSTSNNNAKGPTLTVDLTFAKLNDLYGGSVSVLRLDGPEKTRRRTQFYAHDSSSSSTAVNNGVTQQWRVWRRR